MNVTEVFAEAGLTPQGPLPWGTPITEQKAGVYVIAADEAVLYIGRTRRPLARRLAEFYRHKFGEKAPHRGGQAVIPLPCARSVYWAATDEPVEAETKMIAAFLARGGALPYANRRR